MGTGCSSTTAAAEARGPRGALLLATLLLALLAAGCTACARRAADPSAEALSTTDECDEFRCGDGRCVWNGSRCDGIKNCMDGSDESWNVCRAPAMVLDVSTAKWVRVQYSHAHTAIVLLLCDGIECAALWLWGATNPGGQLRYEAWAGCGQVGLPCRVKQGEVVPSGWRAFGEGPVDLFVERTPPYVRAWLNGSQDKAEVVTKDGQAQLMVRPYNWAKDMPVEFPYRRPF